MKSFTFFLQRQKLTRTWQKKMPQICSKVLLLPGSSEFATKFQLFFQLHSKILKSNKKLITQLKDCCRKWPCNEITSVSSVVPWFFFHLDRSHICFILVVMTLLPSSRKFPCVSKRLSFYLFLHLDSIIMCQQRWLICWKITTNSSNDLLTGKRFHITNFHWKITMPYQSLWYIFFAIMSNTYPSYRCHSSSKFIGI